MRVPASAGRRGGMVLLAIIVLAACAFIAIQRQRTAEGPVSAFGQYRGYSEEVYDGTTRISNYLPLSNGTRLAYDVILPTKSGVVADRPLPTLFQYTPYLRTFTVFDASGKDLVSDLMNFGWEERLYLRVRSWLAPRGNLGDPLFRTEWLETMVKRGYAVVVVEQPGTGASFGTLNMFFDQAAREGDEILNWIAAQPWSDGNIGMFGESWEAHNEVAIASTGNPHLKTIMPVAVSMDMYDAIAYRGGAYNKAFMSVYSQTTGQLEPMITPVDGDDGTLLQEALAERHGVTLSGGANSMLSYPFRDGTMSDGQNYWDRLALYRMLDGVNRSGVSVYAVTGWYDVFTADTLQLYEALTGPKRLMVRPLDHSQLGKSQEDVDFAAEVQRWFDYWLKGIDNGIVAEPPVHYYLMGAEKQAAWQAADAWGPAQQPLTRQYLGEGRSGSSASSNDGRLLAEPSAVAGARDQAVVDYTTTTGAQSRWASVEKAHVYPDLRTNDAKSLTYTSDPLTAPTRLIGHPLAHLWISADAPDADVFVYLEDVDPSGQSTYITEGNLRASQRALTEAPYPNLGMPFHSHAQTDVVPIPPEQPAEMSVDLLPTAYQFPAGHRVRVTLAFADADNFTSPVFEPAPSVQIWRDAEHASWVDLPLLTDSLSREASGNERTRG